MTRNEAINRLITMKCYKVDHTWIKSDIEALDMAIAALREPSWCLTTTDGVPGPTNWRGEEPIE
jgi:hypothetical protein